MGVTGDGALPNANGNVKTIRDYYYRMGLGDLDIVALMGGHTLGGGNGVPGEG
jgi:catalase (peroxidase I)